MKYLRYITLFLPLAVEIAQRIEVIVQEIKNDQNEHQQQINAKTVSNGATAKR